MTEKYVPLRKQVKDGVAIAQSMEQRLKACEEMVEQLKELVLAVVKSERRVVRGKDGSPEAVEILNPDGSVLVRKSIRRDGGRIVGIK